jgi:hypothetical protein
MTWNILPKRNYAIRIFVLEWPEEDTVDDAEDGGVCSDSQRERDDSYKRHARILH